MSKSIEVYEDDNFDRNTILTRSARIRKFKFYQYKPIQESPSTPKTSSNWNHISEKPSANISSKSTKSPIISPREDILNGKFALNNEQSQELSKLDDEICQLERRIADLNNASGNSNSIDNLDEIFELVHKKNDLLRRQMQLNIIEQERTLEKANEELTKELRSLMSIDDSRKSKAQLERQQFLYDQSLALVNKRNELVHQMDLQERGIEDDNALKATLKNVISDSSTRSKLYKNNNNNNNNNHSQQDQNCVIQ